MHDPVFWADGPPRQHWRTQPQSPKVAVVPAQGSLAVRFLAAPVPVWLHWLGRRSFPCLKGCRLCPAEPQRWAGYAPAQVAAVPEWDGRAPHWRLAVLVVTLGACIQLEGVEFWRGLHVLLRRPSGLPDGEVSVKVLPPDPSPLPEAFDVTPILRAMWGLREAVLPGAHVAPRALDAGASADPAIIPFSGVVAAQQTPGPAETAHGPAAAAEAAPETGPPQRPARSAADVLREHLAGRRRPAQGQAQEGRA